MWARLKARERGQAMAEFGVIAVAALALALVVIDLGRALNYEQVMVGLTRQGSDLASRGDSVTESATAVVNGSTPLDLNKNGEVIVTSVQCAVGARTCTGGSNTITDQATLGSLSQGSHIGTLGGKNPPTLSAQATAMLQPGQTIYITEVYYSFQPITPLGNLVKAVMPSSLYEAAYF